MLNLLLVATDGAVPRVRPRRQPRLRPNLLISGEPADAEVTRPGHALAIGDVRSLLDIIPLGRQED